MQPLLATRYCRVQSGTNKKPLEMGKKMKEVKKEQTKNWWNLYRFYNNKITIKTLLIVIANVILFTGAAGLLWTVAYNKGYSEGDNRATERDAMVVLRVREVKDLMSELK